MNVTYKLVLDITLCSMTIVLAFIANLYEGIWFFLTMWGVLLTLISVVFFESKTKIERKDRCKKCNHKMGRYRVTPLNYEYLCPNCDTEELMLLGEYGID